MFTSIILGILAIQSFKNEELFFYIFLLAAFLFFSIPILIASRLEPSDFTLSKMRQLFNQLISFPYFLDRSNKFSLFISVIYFNNTSRSSLGSFLLASDVTQGEVYRIIYLHVPAASVAQSIYYTMVIASITYLIWRIKMASVFMISMAPLGAIFTLALFTGAVWGQPTCTGGFGMQD